MQTTLFDSATRTMPAEPAARTVNTASPSPTPTTEPATEPRLRHLAYTKIGEHRGAGRIYLQNQRLAKVGFGPGVTYEAEFLEGKVRLVQSPRGDRRVVGANKGQKVIPTVDLSTRRVNEALGDAQKVRVLYRDGVIEIDLHPTERAVRKREWALKKGIQMARIATGSLCTGLGVLDHALHAGLSKCGFTPYSRFNVELEEAYLETGLANNPVLNEGLTVQGSLDEIEANLLPPVHILSAGLPCTAASVAGRSAKHLRIPEDDENAGHLLVPFLEVVKATNPAVVVLENVTQYATSASMSVIRTCLKRAGYKLFELTLCGSDFALERRKRMCCIAVSERLAPEGFEIGGVRRHERLSEVLEDLPLDSERWKPYTYLAAKEERDKAKGNGFKTNVLTPEAEEVPTIGRGYNKVRSVEPRLQHPEDPALTRLFTPKEHARIKTVPEEMVEGLCDTTAHQVLGQSIIYAAFEAVGEALGRFLQGLKGETTCLTPSMACRATSAPA